MKASVDSALVRLGYDGKVQQRPVLGLDGAFNLDIPSAGKLASWVGQPLGTLQPDPGPITLRAVFEATASQSAVKEATLSGKALQMHASGSVDQSGPVAVLAARVQVENADLDAYLPPSDASKTPPARNTSAGQPEATGWSEEPLNLSALSMANGDIDIKIDALRYRDLTIKPGHMKVTLKNGVLDAALDPLNIADGTIASTVHLDAASTDVSVAYQVAIAGLPARPLLHTLANNDRLSGNTEFQFKGTARGRSQKELLSSLHGNGQFTFLDGAIHGINLAAALRTARTLGLDTQAAEAQKTDFAELSGSFVINKGVLENRDLRMLAPLVRLSGAGRVPIPEQALDYELTATLVPTLEGQGGKDAMAGLPIPITVQGPWDNIAYNVDWEKVLREVAADPERLQNLPQDVRELSKHFGINLPLPTLPDTGKDVSPLQQLEQLRQQILKEPAAPFPSTRVPQEVPPEGATQSEEQSAPAPTNPLKTLQDLWRR